MMATAPPSQPRAKLQARKISLASPLPPVDGPIPKQFYPKLVLLQALKKPVSEHRPREAAPDQVSEDRRDFLDSFGYLCDYKKGGGSVTAPALEKRPESNFLWLAANEGITMEVKEYAKTILIQLKNVDPTNQADVEDEILQRAVKLCFPRIEVYRLEMVRRVVSCRRRLAKEEPDDASERKQHRDCLTC